MAKSLRSKHKRKMRAIKRERYAKKELAQLKKVLGICDGDVEMSNISDIATVTDAKRNKTTKVEMQMKDSTKPQEFGKKTLRNKHGNYPTWMSSREMKSRVNANRVKKREQKRKISIAKKKQGREIKTDSNNVDDMVVE